MKTSLFKKVIIVLAILASGSFVLGGSLKAPPGMFKDLNDEILGDAIIVEGKQLFIDDYIIEKLDGVQKNLNQPTKHPKNPLIVADKPWEKTFGFSSVMYDEQEGFFKMWYAARPQKKGTYQGLCYATSPDGITWRKPLTTGWNEKEHHNIVFGQTAEFNCAGVFKDPHETDGERRYKMLYSDYPDGSEKTASTSAAYSPDGIEWKAYPENPLIPFSDSHCCPFWDPQRNRYVAYLRFGPPNKRIISRIASEDFINWSPKVTVLNHTKMDDTKGYGWTELYQMEVMPYEGVYFGFITAYRGETIGKIKKEEEAWRDKSDVQLAFSRNGLTWNRVGKHGTIDFSKEHDWETLTKEATFMPYGKHKVDWDWGGLLTLQKPLVVDDEIRIYYRGKTGRHWASYHGDITKSGIGLATLRLDGFVSINAENAGTMTTKPFVFIGDTIELNANATGGSVTVEAIGADGKVIEGFSKEDGQPITTDSVRHILKWKGSGNCQLIQARPIKLKIYMEKAKLYSFTPRILHTHYIPSYD